jgi:hypothetical protein
MAVHSVTINARTHNIMQLGDTKPIRVLQEYECCCATCGAEYGAVTMTDAMAWTEGHVGVVTRSVTDYLKLARLQQDNIERLLES